MQARRESILSGRALVGVSLALLLASCFGKDPIEGEWELSGGARLTFRSKTVTMDSQGLDPVHGGQAGAQWEARWRRAGNETLLIGPPTSHPSLPERRYRIVKLTETELVLKSLDDQSLITGQRRKPS